MRHIYTARQTHIRKMVYLWMHIMILLLSIFLVVFISIDTFKNVAFYQEPEFMTIQFWICIVFLADFFVEWIMAEKKWHYLLTHFIFFLVSIPYTAIFDYFGWVFPPNTEYLIRYIPLVRGGYALALVVDWLTSNRATGLFFSYLISLVATLYFSSVIFFVFEQNINPLVNDYYDALWWAAMDMTTVGSNIIAVTTIGRILSVLLAALGMMLFPIFTVYITNLIQARNKRGWVIGEGNFDSPATQNSANTQNSTNTKASATNQGSSNNQESSNSLGNEDSKQSAAPSNSSSASATSSTPIPAQA